MNVKATNSSHHSIRLTKMEPWLPNHFAVLSTYEDRLQELSIGRIEPHRNTNDIQDLGDSIPHFLLKNGFIFGFSA